VTDAVVRLGRLVEVWRFPVKSMAGERLESAAVDERGLVGDRQWAVYDAEGRLASGKRTNRFRRMDQVFELSARTAGDHVEVLLPGGRQVVAGEGAADIALSDHFGEEVELAPEADIAHQDAGQVSLVGTATLRELGALCGLAEPVDVRHLRANLLVETAEPFIEESWMGRELAVGGVRLRLVERIERCRMVDLEQADVSGIEGLLRVIGAERGLCAGVYADVVGPGTLTAGDDLVG
jgi:MOSC domain-containing protein